MSKDTALNEFKPIYLEKVFAQKNPKLAGKIPSFIYNYLKKVIHQDELNYFFGKYGASKGVEFTKHVLKYLNITYEIKGLENLPKDRRCIFASNHPLGGADGIMLISCVGAMYDILFPVNDILLNVKSLDNIFLPINKHGKQARQAAENLNKAFDSDKQILIFPAGLVSRKHKGGKIRDLEWKKTFISKAIQSKRDIIPVHVSGQNSNFFYNLANTRKFLGIKSNLEMLYLVDEFSKHRGENFTITFGKPISYTSLTKEKSQKEWAEEIKNIVHTLK
jgi:1-acyl-sn-glycerol-3-phosphate acyltransferase